ADPGVGRGYTEVVEGGLDQARLIGRGDGDVAVVERSEIEGEHAPAVEIDAGARRDNVRPPAAFVGRVHEAMAGDAAGDDDQRRVGRTVEAGAEDRVGGRSAAVEAQAGRDGDETVDAERGLGARTFGAIQYQCG